MSRERWQVVFFCIAACAAGLVVYLVDPHKHQLIPCIFNSLTGWQCAGCGMTRAAHDLLHADWSLAWQDNPLVFLLVPLGTYAGFRRLHAKWHSAERPILLQHRVLQLTALLALVLFMVVRNVL